MQSLHLTNTIQHCVNRVKSSPITSRLALTIPIISQIYFTTKIEEYRDRYSKASDNDKPEILKEWKALNDSAAVWTRVQYIFVFTIAIISLPPGLDKWLCCGVVVFNESELNISREYVKLRKDLKTFL